MQTELGGGAPSRDRDCDRRCGGQCRAEGECCDAGLPSLTNGKLGLVFYVYFIFLAIRVFEIFYKNTVPS